MIIKIQQSQFTTTKTKQMLIYNEDRSLFHEDELSKEVEEVLNGRPKAYFEAEINKYGALSILKEVDEPNW
jgi:hypothetical protein